MGLLCQRKAASGRKEERCGRLLCYSDSEEREIRSEIIVRDVTP